MKIGARGWAPLDVGKILLDGRCNKLAMFVGIPEGGAMLFRPKRPDGDEPEPLEDWLANNDAKGESTWFAGLELDARVESKWR